MKHRILAGFVSFLVVLSPGAFLCRAESAVHEVRMALHDFVLNPASGLWFGTVTLTVGGVTYAGTGVWWITDLSTNEDTLHWFATGIYDFADLGSIEIRERGGGKWGIVEPGYRLSPLKGMNSITTGTGAFANAHGVLHYDDTYQLEVVGGGLPVVNGALWGHIHGIEIED